MADYMERTRISVEVAPRTKDKLKALAKKHHRKLSDEIRVAIRAHIGGKT